MPRGTTRSAPRNAARAQRPADAAREGVAGRGEGRDGRQPAAAAGDQVGCRRARSTRSDTLIGLDRDLNLTLRLNGADLPVPDAGAQALRPLQEAAEGGEGRAPVRGRAALRPVRDGRPAAGVRVPAEARVSGPRRPLSRTSATLRGTPRLQRAPACVRRARDHGARCCCRPGSPPRSARRVDRLLRDAARGRSSTAGAGGRACCARRSSRSCTSCWSRSRSSDCSWPRSC